MGPYDELARRTMIHLDVDGEMETAEKCIYVAASMTLKDSQWHNAYGEAWGDLKAAEARGMGVEDELRMLGALIQCRLERIERERAEEPLA